jgi:hypothetical protein
MELMERLSLHFIAAPRPEEGLQYCFRSSDTVVGGQQSEPWLIVGIAGKGNYFLVLLALDVAFAVENAEVLLCSLSCGYYGRSRSPDRRGGKYGGGYQGGKGYGGKGYGGYGKGGKGYGGSPNGIGYGQGGYGKGGYGQGGGYSGKGYGGGKGYGKGEYMQVPSLVSISGSCCLLHYFTQQSSHFHRLQHFVHH